MKSQQFRDLRQQAARERGKLAIIWYLVPAGWILVALAGFFVMTEVPELLAGPPAGQIHQPGEVLSITPSGSGQPAVPAASSVFSDIAEPVQAF